MTAAHCVYSGCDETVPQSGGLCRAHTPNDDWCEMPPDERGSYPPVDDSSPPVVLAQLRRGRVDQLVITDCDVCGGDTHLHGATGAEPGDRTMRTPHCDIPLDERPDEYVIAVVGEADE